MSQYNELPMPASSETAVVPVTYAENYIPVNYKDVELLINGTDLIVQSGDKKLILPLAAKLASLDPNIFTFSFKDGVTINANELISKSQSINTAPKLTENNESDVTEKNEMKGQDEHEVIEPVANESIEIIVVNNLDSQLQKDEESVEDLEKLISKNSSSTISDNDNNISENIPYPSTSDTAESSKEKFIAESHEIIDINDNNNNNNDDSSDEIDIPSIKLLQIKSVVNNSSKILIAGTGNDEAAESENFNIQYENIHIDLSGETENWTIYANDETKLPIGQIGRVIEINDATSVVSVTGQLGNMKIITADSALGKEFGLAANQFLIIYPEGIKSSFSLAFSYIDNQGNTVNEQANFDITDHPAIIVDNTGHFQLSSTKNNVDITAGSGDDTIFAGNQNGHYDGGAGTNTVNYSQLKESLVIDLNNGKTDAKNTHHTLKNIQNVIGSNNGDTIIGHSQENNILTGGDGNDTIMSGGGNNIIDGGKGINTIAFENVTSGVHVDLSANKVINNGNGGTDSVKNIQNITGSDFDDILIGDDQDNLIVGGKGNDTLSGRGGNNTLDGGEGINTADYSDAESGIEVDLTKDNNQVEDNGFGGKDTLINIQAIVGSDYDDKFITGVGTTIIDGGAGDDHFKVGGNEASITFLSGNSGNNTYEAGAGFNNYLGGTGFDTLSYVNAAYGISIDFNKSIVYDNGFSGIDILKDINKVIGTNFDDYFVLGNGDHSVDGGLGNNTIIAGSGNNKIDGGSQGAGFINTVDYSNATSGLEMDLVTGDVAKNGFGGQDNVTNIQKIIATDFDDVIYSSANDLSILAGAGNDTVYGNYGNDILDGGEGVNTLRYDALSDGVTINMSNGTVTKTSGTDNFTNFNTFIGSKGSDVFIAAAGNQTIDGSSGHDAIDYSGMSGRMVAHLDTNQIDDDVKDRHLFHHTVKNIDEVRFSNASGNVGYTKTSGSTKFVGGSSNDTFYILGGNNEIFGGSGTDIISYRYSTTGKGVVVELNQSGTGYATQNSYGGKDHIVDVETVYGTEFNDYIKSFAEMRGFSGNDTLEGVGKNAWVDYGDASNVDIDLEKGIAVKSGGKTTGTDKLININKVVTGSGDSIVRGNDNDNVITGRFGNDTFYASTGNDSYNGDRGNDTLIYNELNNTKIEVNLNTNTIVKTHDNGNQGVDNYKSIENIIGTNGNDIFKITSLADLNGYQCIDGGQGFDVVKKSGQTDNFFFGSSTIFKHIDSFDFKDNSMDRISIDLSTFFDALDTDSVEFVLDSNDSLALINSSSWSHSVNGSKEIWTDGTHELIVDRV